MDPAPPILTCVVRAIVKSIAASNSDVAEETLIRLRDACLRELEVGEPDVVIPPIPPITGIGITGGIQPSHQQPDELVVISQEFPEHSGSYFLMEDGMWVSASGKQIRSTPAGKWTVNDVIFSVEQHLGRMPNMLSTWCFIESTGITLCRETHVASPVESRDRSTSPVRQPPAVESDSDIRQQLLEERLKNSELLSSLKSMQKLLLTHVGSVPSFNEIPILAR